MEKFSKKEQDEKKKAIFDAMGKRGQKRILKHGYDKWEPFAEPKHPIDIRKDVTQRTAQDLVSEFMLEYGEENQSTIFAEGVLEIALGMMNNNDKIRGMYEYSLWYAKLLEKEGVELE